MEYFFYTLITFITCGWLHRFYKVKQISRSEYFIKNDKNTDLESIPAVSILIPAKNEEKNIVRCVESLLEQDHKDIDIIVIDDRSTDATAELVTEIAKKDKRVRLLKVDHCPDGWSGKNHALVEGVKLAKHDVLVFTDADTYHYPHCISTAVDYAIENKVDMLSINPHLVAGGIWENLIMPVAGGVLMLWFPMDLINSDSSDLSYANGQFILFDRKSYDLIGGHQSVKEDLLEDLALAKNIKSGGLKLKVLWGPQLYQTRMYTNLKDLWNGWVRIFYHGFEKNIVKVILSISTLFLFAMVPYVLLIFSFIGMTGLLPKTVTIILFFSMYVTLFSAYPVVKSNRLYTLFHLFSSVCVCLILLHTAINIIFKRKIVWRGMSYTS